VEGSISTSTDRFLLAKPAGEIRIVDTAEFNRKAARRFVGARSEHDGKRVVVCEPARGLFGRWFRKVEPSRFLAQAAPPNMVYLLSTGATELRAERARKTYSLLRRIAAELEEFKLPVLAKLGFPIDPNSGSGGENLWFAIHEMYDDEIDATLENEPVYVEGLCRGDRGRHSIDRITDWQVLTPFGPIDPRSTVVFRRIQENPDEFRRIMQTVS